MNHYTFKKPSDLLFQESVIKNRTPKAAASKIFRRLLRHVQADTLDTILVVKKLNSGKLYYYKCMAVLDPHQKEINYKIITIKYRISLIKLNSENVSLGQ